MTAKSIVNLNCTLSVSDRVQAVEDCIVAFHMRRNEANLLRFYASQANGFAPSKLHTSNVTGIRPENIKKYRNLLVEDGLVGIDDYHINIDWNRICTFAMLKDEPGAIPAHRSHRKVAKIGRSDISAYHQDMQFWDDMKFANYIAMLNTDELEEVRRGMAM